MTLREHPCGRLAAARERNDHDEAVSTQAVEGLLHDVCGVHPW